MGRASAVPHGRVSARGFISDVWEGHQRECTTATSGHPSQPHCGMHHGHIGAFLEGVPPEAQRSPPQSHARQWACREQGRPKRAPSMPRGGGWHAALATPPLSPRQAEAPPPPPPPPLSPTPPTSLPMRSALRRHRQSLLRARSLPALRVRTRSRPPAQTPPRRWLASSRRRRRRRRPSWRRRRRRRAQPRRAALPPPAVPPRHHRPSCPPRPRCSGRRRLKMATPRLLAAAAASRRRRSRGRGR